MALPYRTTGSLEPTFVSARLVGLAVKPACTLALYDRLPTDLSGPYARLRYFLGGDRPSQTTHLTRSPTRIHGVGLDLQPAEGGIPRVAPQELASLLHSLPPILYTTNQRSMSSCSKGSRGLSVLQLDIDLWFEIGRAHV